LQVEHAYPAGKVTNCTASLRGNVADDEGTTVVLRFALAR
jgi:hypothetical protein